MCGICGEYNFLHRRAEKSVIQSMLEVLHHRGPDDEGIYIADSIGLGHKRLSIIDLDTGKQPISNEEGNLQIIFNGEIYNFTELKDSLKKRGHVFKTKTDTEVIIHLFEDYGVKSVEKLQGMFAFALWDEKEKKLFLARDRIGKKPLYYTVTSDACIFASEIKALLKHPGVGRDINISSIDTFLTYQYIPAPLTIFKNIFSLPPGHTMMVNQDKKICISRYWEIDFSKKLSLSMQEAEEAVLNTLKKAVRKRMISDVPLGAFLSGGIDSSAVVALMSEISERKVKTFSIGFEEEPFSELEYARIIAHRYNTEHHEFIVKPDAVEILPKLVWHYDQPYADSSALPSYYLARETRKYVTVALNGDGGDENFAGYLRHRANIIASTLSHMVPKGAWHVLDSAIPLASKQKSFLRYFKRFVQAAGEPPARRNLLWHCLFRDELKRELYTGDMKNELKDTDSYSFMEDIYNQSKSNNLLDSILYTDINAYLPYDLLVKMDIATMAHSLEVRSPFLDHELMELSAGLPSKFKMHLFNGKYVLKKCIERYVPSQILKRRKMGFGVPLEQWFRRKKLNSFLKDTVLSTRSIERGYFNKKFIETLITEHEEKKVDHGYRLWALLVFEIWHRVFMDS